MSEFEIGPVFDNLERSEDAACYKSLQSSARHQGELDLYFHSASYGVKQHHTLTGSSSVHS